MAERLAHRDLRNRSAEILRDVAAGASYEITNHGEVVALLSPPSAGTDLRIRRPKLDKPFADIPRVPRDTKVEEVLDDLRRDR